MGGFKKGVSMHDLVNAFIVVGWCYHWQAVMLPTPVSQGEADDDEVE